MPAAVMGCDGTAMRPGMHAWIRNLCPLCVRRGRRRNRHACMKRGAVKTLKPSCARAEGANAIRHACMISRELCETQKPSCARAEGGGAKAYVLRSMLPGTLRARFLQPAQPDPGAAFALVVLAIVNLVGGRISEGARLRCLCLLPQRGCPGGAAKAWCEYPCHNFAILCRIWEVGSARTATYAGSKGGLGKHPHAG